MSVCCVLPVKSARPLIMASSDALSSGELLTDRETLVPSKADGLSWLPPRSVDRYVQLLNMYDVFVHAPMSHPLASMEERAVQLLNMYDAELVIFNPKRVFIFFKLMQPENVESPTMLM